MTSYVFRVHGLTLAGLSPEDSYVRRLRAQRKPEPQLLTFLRAQYDTDGDYVFADIGANIGYTALLMARLFPRATVHAFEPGPTVFPLLRHNVEGARVVPVNAAVSSRSGTVAFVENSAYGHMVPQAAGGSTPMVSMADYAARTGIARFDFVKIDVEGFELDVFRGLGGLTDTVLFEFNTFALDCHSRVNPLTLLEELSADWDLYEFMRTDRLETIDDFPAVLHRTMIDRRTVSNLVAVRKGRALRQDLIDPTIRGRQILDLGRVVKRFRARLEAPR
ncbi:FkbM family methyltransferase [Polymorphum gilvum]|uniref:Methyltransferase FkbM family n=1 Tax=Polymorphum gilvum (strain LMG 25793 / CGMCC 1.9160 / SL003B-26A1) TaxID=991905 RepID=F2J696_POLGS|nr:FkbM family methyltransferase [Polymorphum gilvum]ADZ71270.1 Methyltransferase FkbM family [Polymorphum gilvum SL003B-26A1]